MEVEKKRKNKVKKVEDKKGMQRGYEKFENNTIYSLSVFFCSPIKKKTQKKKKKKTNLVFFNTLLIPHQRQNNTISTKLKYDMSLDIHILHLLAFHQWSVCVNRRNLF